MKVIYTIYQYIFYKCFRAAWLVNRNWLNLRQESYIASIARTAWLAITAVLNANFLLFVLIIGAFRGYDLLFGITNYFMLVLLFSFLLINYFIFLYKKQYKKIIKKFENESPRSRIIGNILVASYVLILFPGSFILAYLISIFYR